MCQRALHLDQLAGWGQAMIRTPKVKPRRTERELFDALFAKLAHPDGWGIPCVYDYEVWEIWKAAKRQAARERKR